MKRLLSNLGVFIFSMLFLFSGFSRDSIQNIKKENQIEVVYRNSTINLEDITGRVNEVLENGLRYRYFLLNLNSAKENLLGFRVKKKQDTLIVRADSGKLVGDIQESRIMESQQEESVSYIKSIKTISEDNKAKFLCCAVPAKTEYEALPINIVDYSGENQEHVRAALKEENIPVLDFKTVFIEKGMENQEVFFTTDHHWKPFAGFIASQAICEALRTKYGFEYNKDYADIKSYDRITYPRCFLGSYGKKVGLFFTWNGADDFDLITPNFPTSLTEEVPQISRTRDGDFQNTLLFLENLEKDYYNNNTYVTYSGGDYRLQIIKNRLLPDGPRIVVVRSSFACVVTPFLALQAGELYVVDDREGDYPEGDVVDLEQLISELRPDYVIVIKQL